MANYRQIHTKLWSKGWFEPTDPAQKLLFIYFLTNPYRNESGLYELSKKRMRDDTGLTEAAVDKALEGLESIGKAYYRNGWVFVCNVLKYARLNDLGKVSVRNDFQHCPVSELKGELYSRYGAAMGLEWDGKSIPLFPEEQKPKEEELPVKAKKQAEELHALQKWIAESLPNVSRLKVQMSAKQCDAILHKFDKQQVVQTLRNMDNYAPLTKKYVNVYQTLSNWLTRDGAKRPVAARKSRNTFDLHVKYVCDKCGKEHVSGSDEEKKCVLK